MATGRVPFDISSETDTAKSAEIRTLKRSAALKSCEIARDTKCVELGDLIIKILVWNPNIRLGKE